MVAVLRAFAVRAVVLRYSADAAPPFGAISNSTAPESARSYAFLQSSMLKTSGSDSTIPVHAGTPALSSGRRQFERT